MNSPLLWSLRALLFIAASFILLRPCSSFADLASKTIVPSIPVFPASEYSFATSPVVWRGKLFFSQETSSGRELWVTDGTPAGTRMVVDLAPGASGSNPAPLPSPDAAPGVFFSADSGGSIGDNPEGSGRELWITDGTAAGTARLSDIAPGPLSSSPEASFVWLNGRGFFVARKGTVLSLYSTNGTAAGTSAFKTFEEGGPRQAISLIGSSTRIYILVRYASLALEIWSTDGTLVGTSLAASFPSTFSYFGSPLLGFGPDGRLWVILSDPVFGREIYLVSPTGATLLKDLVPGPQGSDPYQSGMAVLPSGLVLFSTASQFNQEPALWRSDGTAAGTFPIRGLSIGSNESRIFVVSGNLAYVPVYANVTGFELWRTDGTDAGTFLVKEVVPGITPSDPPPFARVDINGTLYFAGGNGAIWKTNGTEATTVKVSDVKADVGSHFVAAIGGAYYFAGADGEKRGVFKIDGAVTQQLAGPFPKPDAIRPLVAANDTIFFANKTGTENELLWRTDGTPGGTFSLGINPGTAFRSRYEMAASGNKVFFPGLIETGFRQGIYTSDGTVAGTTLAKDVGEYSVTDIRRLSAVNGGAAFNRFIEGQGGDPFFSDGTVNGTVAMADVRADGFDCFSGPFFSFNGSIFFGTDDGTSGLELWRKPSGPAPATLFRNLSPDTDLPVHSHPRDFTSLGSKFLFTAQAGDAPQRILWVSDGTAAGTLPVPCAAADPRSLVRLGSFVYFSARNGASGRELWRTDGTEQGTTLVLDINPGAGSEHSSSPDLLTAVGSILYFTADDGPRGVELWRTDGTPAGTRIVRDIIPGRGSSAPQFLTEASGKLAFTALDLTHGRELWLSDGLEAGTTLAHDFIPGAADPAISKLTVARGQIFWYGQAPGSTRPGLHATILP